jgi:hypothetical protein
MFPPFGFLIQEFFICYFYCQKTAFVFEFQHTPLRKRTRNKNVRSHKPYLSPKMVFLAPETLLYLSGTVEKNFFFDFEPYDLTNGKESVSKIWWACRHTS